ncbi:hypothetical protein [Renibacterium salmoninarum]|nr:hypothetical protein [Renibacterium salmoninarum]
MNTSVKRFFRQRLSPVALFCVLSVVASTLISRLKADDGDERGDVPGWVMVTLMSALLVVGLLAIAGPALAKMFEDAIGKVGK